MEKIGLDKLIIYHKYDGEYALLFERWADKKDQNKISAEEFGIMDSIVDNLTMLRTNKYSKELVKNMKLELEIAKEKVTEEVFNFLETGQKPEVKTKSWLGRIFNK